MPESAVPVIPGAEVIAQPVVDQPAQPLERVEDCPGGWPRSQLSATGALYLGPDGSGRDVCGYSGSVGRDDCRVCEAATR